MKKLFLYSWLQIVFSCVYCQNPTIIFNDTISNFKGDLPIGLFQLENGNKFLRIKSNDSTFLYKEYSKHANKLFSVYECNLEGYRQGYFYYLDTINSNQTHGQFFKGELIHECTINVNNDTIGYDKKINDTLVYHMETMNGLKKVWQTNINLIYNGYYKVLEMETNAIIKEGYYKSIKESMLMDRKKYIALLKKYDLGPYMFRGEQAETEIPTGAWNFYDENGKLLKTIIYDWEGCFENY